MNSSENNFGIGTDIETVSRFQDLDRDKDANFLNKIFTDQELDGCFLKKNPAPHLAVRFAAKEAVFKALTMFGVKNLPMNKLEIVNREDGVPEVHVHDTDLTGIHIALSMSHCQDKALAFVVINRV